MRWFCVPVLCLGFSGMVWAEAGILEKYILSDQRLIEINRAGFDVGSKWYEEKPGEPASRTLRQGEFIGFHNNTPVRALYFCSDLCPDYTTRVIVYDVVPTKCAEVGGVMVARPVPYGIAVLPRNFCVPRPIAEDRK